MPQVPFWQVDAFTDQLYRGNPAAVCLLDSWPSDTVLQAIAAENNLSETAFLFAEGESFHLRWFTPATEVTLCGHATLASAHVVHNHLRPDSALIRFNTVSGELSVSAGEDGFQMNFPSRSSSCMPFSAETYERALGARPLAVYRSSEDWIAEFAEESDVQNIKPDFAAIARQPCRGLIATAPGNSDGEFVSRFFGPAVGVNEDPVTGSAHCALIPFWHKKTGRDQFIARQLSQRGGIVHCQYLGERVILGGQTVEVISGRMRIPEG